MAKEKITDVYQTTCLEDFISVLYTQFAQGRKPYEERWQENWWNYIGQYNPDRKLQTTEGQQNRSRVFVRLTQQKVRAAQAKIMESIGMEVPFKLVPINNTPQTEYDLAQIASAQKDIIRDQFRKIDLRDTFDTATLEMGIYGTAVLKGPVVTKKTIEGVEENVKNVMGMQVPLWKIPMTNYPHWKRVFVDVLQKDVYPVSLWDFYTDNNADANNKSIGCMERHNYSPYEYQKIFIGDEQYNQENAIYQFNLATVPDYIEKLEVQQGEKYMGQVAPKDTKITVVEYWGQAPYSLIKEYLNDEDRAYAHKDTDIVECSAILAGTASQTDVLTNLSVLKVRLNPSGDRIYRVCPFIKNPGSPWGIGVAESIRDSQMLINSLTRLMVDNKALSGNGMFAIQKEQLDTRATKDGLKVYPGKVFFIKGDVNTAIKPLAFPDVTGGIEVAIDRFERWADEESGIPKYTQGESSSFLNKTATGMSMIINQSNIFLKTTIRNIDEFWIKPLAKAFNLLNEVDGSYPTNINVPLDVVPLGVDSLMAKEIKFENAMKLFQVAKETDLLPYLNKTNALKLVSDLLDVKGLVVTDVEAEQISQMLQAQAANASQASLSANIGSDLLGALTDGERAQVLQKMGVQSDPQADAKLLIRKAQGLELETQAKIMVNDRKELGKAQGKAADNILGSMLDKEPKAPQTVVENVNEVPER